MSVLFNPMLDEEIKEYILQNWQKKVLLDGGGKDLTEYKFGEEKSAIKENCSLNFNWFKTTNEEEKSKLDELDFIICTVTKQENSKSNDYPSVFEILNSVKKDLDRKYFMNNIANGIATFQDSQVLKEMKNSVNRM